MAAFASLALVGCLLSQSFPADPLVAEEDAHELRDPAQGPILQKVTDFVRRVLPDAMHETVCDWIDLGGAETGKRFWTLDPIDGTKGFLRGEQYAVALALIMDGEVQLGVLGCPNLSEAANVDLGGPGSLVVAVRGQGAWTTSLVQPGRLSPLHASRAEVPQRAGVRVKLG